MNIDAIRARAEAWTREPHDQETRTAVQAMLDDADANPLLEAFHQDLAFGTGGMRGIMRPGPNRRNAAVAGLPYSGQLGLMGAGLIAALTLAPFATAAALKLSLE